METTNSAEKELNDTAHALSVARHKASRYRYCRRHPYRNRELALPEDPPEFSRNTLLWTEHLEVILAGTRDDGSPLALLRGFEGVVVKEIYSMLFHSWRDSIRHTLPAHLVGRIQLDGGDSQPEPDQDISESDPKSYRLSFRGPIPVKSTVLALNPDHHRILTWSTLGQTCKDRPQIAFTTCGEVEEFPPPLDRNVNMMPFIMGKEESLPCDLRPYYALIASCPVPESEIGKVCYLTVSERFIRASDTQRRGGLHIEAPRTSLQSDPAFTAAREHAWGMGVAFTQDELHGGIYMASNMDNTSCVWDALVDKSASNSHGAIEHLRPFLGEGHRLQAGELIWMTDRTPHEAVPQEVDGYRQFFRLVTNEISIWYADHCTPNPSVPLPDFVKVTHENKFAAEVWQLV
jgi:hypothetical protein